jgi:nucleotide-binding universal stress UspA family protein
MTKVLAAIDNTSAARPVLAAATAFADLLDADVEAIHAKEDGGRTARAAAEAAGVPLRMSGAHVVPMLLEEGGAAEVAALVLGARAIPAGPRPAGHVALRLAVSLPKPLVVVPPDATVPSAFDRILVPLNGERTTTAALAKLLTLARDRELEVVVLHVHELDSLPLFTDQPHHELTSWAREFLRRHCPHPDQVRLDVRIGFPGEHVIRVATQIDADLIVLGWAQELAEGHAAVVREALGRSCVPVLLVPVATRVDPALAECADPLVVPA